MTTFKPDEAIDKLPVAELQADLDLILQPVLRRLPEKRLRAVGNLAVQGILGSQSPLLTKMARGDAGLDDQKIFHQMALVHADSTIRACHNRTVEVYNDRLDRWESELLDDLTGSVPLPLKFRVAFTHARKVRHVDIELG